jgi:hypothetical protein
MKKVLVMLSLITAFAISAFAKDKITISNKVKQSFEKEFAGAQAVSWSEAGEYQKASFVIGGHRAEAYYDADGEFSGCIRDLFYDQLPLAVMTTVDKAFPNAAMLDVREITNADGTNYKLTLEVNSNKYSIKLNSTGQIVEKVKLKK